MITFTFLYLRCNSASRGGKTSAYSAPLGATNLPFLYVAPAQFITI